MYLLFDIGGTNMRIAVSDGRKILKIKAAATPKNFRRGLKAFEEIAEELGGGKKFKAVVGGLAGSFDRTRSKIIGGGSNIKAWGGKPLKKILERAFRAPVYLENDAALAGLAETRRGAGKGKEIVAYLTWSTGVGGARIVKGRIDYYARGFEPGHQIVDAYRVCRKCGGKFLGAHISGRAIEKHFGKKPENITNPKIWDELTRWFAIAVNNTIVYWSPDIVVVGGSVAKSVNFKRLRQYLVEIYRNSKSPPPPVRRARLGDLAGLQGALIFLKQNPL